MCVDEYKGLSFLEPFQSFHDIGEWFPAFVLIRSGIKYQRFQDQPSLAPQCRACHA